jgi:hypothetical protein
MLKNLTNDQLLACVEFNQLLVDTSPTAVLVWLGEVEVENVTSKALVRLLACFNRLFFPGADMDLEFEWIIKAHVYGHCLDYQMPTAPDALPVVMIGLNNRDYKKICNCLPLNHRAAGRLSTSLHEVVHAYFRIYSCRRCESSCDSVRDTAGHGRAWQRVANLVDVGSQVSVGTLAAQRCPTTD